MSFKRFEIDRKQFNEDVLNQTYKYHWRKITNVKNLRDFSDYVRGDGVRVTGYYRHRPQY